MDEKTNKKKITWWHLFAAGGGIRILYNMNHNSPPFLIGVLADLLSVVGIGWGILILVRYLFRKKGVESHK